MCMLKGLCVSTPAFLGHSNSLQSKHTHTASPVIPAKHKHLHTPTPVMAQVLGLLLWQQCLCMGMFESLKYSGSRHILRLCVEATPWFLHAYSKKTPHKPTFSHHPGERPAGCVLQNHWEVSLGRARLCIWRLHLVPDLVPQSNQSRAFLTCGCWAGSCVRHGTRSLVAGESWKFEVL